MEDNIITNNKLNIEDQFILRLPPTLSHRFRKMLKNPELEAVNLTFGSDPKRGVFRIGEETFDATLANLPCVVETHKTLNDKTFYKSGDVGQIIVVEDPEAEEEVEFGEGPESLSGLTPASTNIRKRKFELAKKPHEYTKVQVREGEEELTRRQDGRTDSADTRYEKIKVSNIRVIYKNPKGQAIVMKKKGHPVLIGAERKWTNEELAHLPPADRETIRTLQSRTMYDDEEEELDMDLDAPAPAPVLPPAAPAPRTMAPPTTSQSDGFKIRKLRRKKIEIANDVKRLRDSMKSTRLLIQSESNQVMRKKMEEEWAQAHAAILDKRQESLGLDTLLQSLGAV